MCRLKYFLSGLLCFGLSLGAQAQVIHTEKSLYRNIIVDEQDGLRCLKFSLRLKNSQNQSCQDQERPNHLVFDYAQMVMGGLFVQPHPKRILVLGLGGGSLPTAFRALFPESEIDNVEIDEAVVTVAERYFSFKVDERMRVHLRDGRLYVKKAQRQGERYDFIVLDAFNGEYIPEHMMTREFLHEVKALLTADGVVVANTFSTSRLYAHESVTYQAVFGSFLNVLGQERRNRVIIATAGKLPTEEALELNAQMLSQKLDLLGVDSNKILSQFSTLVDWDASQRPLTDQFAPANLLQSQ